MSSQTPTGGQEAANSRLSAAPDGPYGLLDPNSFTAHRLHHANPAHLHLTSRRIFIGPVPKGWLKNHRGEWFKEHFNVNYSPKSKTFTSSEDVVGQRNLGLPGNSQRLAVGNEEDLIDMTEAIEDNTESSTASQGVPVSDSEVEKQRGGGGHTPYQAGTSSQSPIDIVHPKSSNDRPRYSASPAPRHEFGESWRTASESFGGRSPSEHGHSNWHNEGPLTVLSPEPEDTASQFEGADRSRQAGFPFRDTPGPDLEVEEPAPSAGGSESGGSSVAPKSVEATNSLASLLVHGNDVRKKKTNSLPFGSRLPRSLLKTPSFLSPAKSRSRAQSETPQTEKGLKVASNNDRVAGGMVRFNTALDMHERDKHLQLKLAELSRRRTLRQFCRHPRFRRRDGEIIKMENMLIRVECVTSTLPVDYDENESIKYDTQVLERWREFIVVCREGSSEDSPMYIQLYKSRTVLAIDRRHISSHSTLNIPLTPRCTHVNLYSPLDKSLVVWHPRKSYTLIFILRPRCSSSSVEWYTFLRRALGWTRPEELNIVVPALSVTLTISNPFSKVEQEIAGDDGNRQAGELLAEEKAMAGDLITKLMAILRRHHHWDEILDKWQHEERMGLAWRKYDRLEWIYGVNEQRMYGTIGMQKTHVLELRPKIHYPTDTVTPNGERLTEPVPVEGFLVRLSRSMGQHRQYKNLYFAKRYYWSVHDNLLCFCRPARALPPAPPNLSVHDGVVPLTSQIVDKLPLMYDVAPYELDQNKHIKWLNYENAALLEKHDLIAYHEAERKVNTILRSEGFIDLTTVERVELIRKDAEGDAASPMDGYESPMTETTQQHERNSNDIYHEKVFRLVFNNGLDVKFQTYDRQTRDEWVTRLHDLTAYWKARGSQDMTLIRRTRQENLKELHIDEEMEALLGEHARKWEVSHASVCPELYHVCGISSCRAITMSGTLYRKPRKHSTFSRYHVVLCHGELLLFNYTPRTRSGKPIPHIQHDRVSSVSLQDCFIYSGAVTSGDLIYNPQTFDTNGPVRHALPKIYSDGLTSQDEDKMLCFVLWQGRRRGWRSGTDADGKEVLTIKERFGVSRSKALVFKAPTRIHRDVWVMNINMEIERLHTKAFDEIVVKS